MLIQMKKIKVLIISLVAIISAVNICNAIDTNKQFNYNPDAELLAYGEDDGPSMGFPEQTTTTMYTMSQSVTKEGKVEMKAEGNMVYVKVEGGVWVAISSQTSAAVKFEIKSTWCSSPFPAGCHYREEVHTAPM